MRHALILFLIIASPVTGWGATLDQGDLEDTAAPTPKQQAPSAGAAQVVVRPPRQAPQSQPAPPIQPQAQAPATNFETCGRNPNPKESRPAVVSEMFDKILGMRNSFGRLLVSGGQSFRLVRQSESAVKVMLQTTEYGEQEALATFCQDGSSIKVLLHHWYKPFTVYLSPINSNNLKMSGAFSGTFTSTAR